MTHPRKIIRQAAVAHLVDKTAAEERVFAGRLMPVEEPELPPQFNADGTPYTD